MKTKSVSLRERSRELTLKPLSCIIILLLVCLLVLVVRGLKQAVK